MEMPKAIVRPTASKLLEISRDKLVKNAKANGITLKQTFRNESKNPTRNRASRYGHDKQFWRMRNVINRHGITVGRLSRRGIVIKASALCEAVQEPLMQSLARANDICLQIKQGKNIKNTRGPKIYSCRLPEVSCIVNGKVKTPHEFGSKVSIARTAR